MVVELDSVWEEWALLAVSDAVAEVGTDVIEVAILVVDEVVEEDAVGGSSAVMLK